MSILVLIPLLSLSLSEDAFPAAGSFLATRLISLSRGWGDGGWGGWGVVHTVPIADVARRSLPAIHSLFVKMQSLKEEE